MAAQTITQNNDIKEKIAATLLTSTETNQPEILERIKYQIVTEIIEPLNSKNDILITNNRIEDLLEPNEFTLINEANQDIFIVPYTQPSSQESSNQDITIVKAFGISLQPKDIQSLVIESKNNERWLNDNIVNFYFSLLINANKQKTKDIIALPSQSFQKYQSKGNNIKLIKENIFDYNQILVPVCYENHWSMAVIKTNEKKVRYFDSLGKQTQAKTRNDLLKKYITNIITADAEQKKIKIKISEWVFRAESNVQQQTNSYDCGLFVCSFAKSIIDNNWSPSITFAERELEIIRNRMSKEIMNCELINTNESS